MAHTAPCLRRLALAATLLSVFVALAAVAAPAHAQQPKPDQLQPNEGSGDVPIGQTTRGGLPWPDGDAYDLQPQPQPQPVAPRLITSRTVAGKIAMVRADGRAAIPRRAPKRVRVLIAQANQIVGKPYVWGGGHAKLADRGYDCSGMVSYALIKAAMLRGTLVSGAFRRWGSAGAGRWISVYAHRSHVYMEVAGLRLDTSSVGDIHERAGVRWRPLIGRRAGFSARHPVGL